MYKTVMWAELDNFSKTFFVVTLYTQIFEEIILLQAYSHKEILLFLPVFNTNKPFQSHAAYSLYYGGSTYIWTNFGNMFPNKASMNKTKMWAQSDHFNHTFSVVTLCTQIFEELVFVVLTFISACFQYSINNVHHGHVILFISKKYRCSTINFTYVILKKN